MNRANIVPQPIGHRVTLDRSRQRSLASAKYAHCQCDLSMEFASSQGVLACSNGCAQWAITLAGRHQNDRRIWDTQPAPRKEAFMSAIEGATANDVARRIVNDFHSPKNKTRRLSLLRFAWWTVPIHIVLGFGFWWMMTNRPDELGTVLLWFHIGFPALLAVTIRMWWDRWGELALLLTINHLATFAVLACLPWT